MRGSGPRGTHDLLCLATLLQRSGDDVAGTATGYGPDDYGVGVRVTVVSRNVSSPRPPDWLWGPPSLRLELLMLSAPNLRRRSFDIRYLKMSILTLFTFREFFVTARSIQNTKAQRTVVEIICIPSGLYISNLVLCRSAP
jgi:hypothetical protein